MKIVVSMGVKFRFAAIFGKIGGKIWYNGGKLHQNGGKSRSFIRNRGNLHLQAVNFSSVKELCKATERCRNR